MPIVNPLVPFEYTLECDRQGPEEARTTWVMRPLTWAEKTAISQVEVIYQSQLETVTRYNQLEKARKIINWGLTGFQNLRTPAGPVTFEKVGKGELARWPDELFDLIQDHVLELANAITERTDLSEEQARKSTSP